MTLSAGFHPVSGQSSLRLLEPIYPLEMPGNRAVSVEYIQQDMGTYF